MVNTSLLKGLSFSIVAVAFLASFGGIVTVVSAEDLDPSSSLLRGATTTTSSRTAIWDEQFVRNGARATNLTHLVKADDLMDSIDFYNTQVYQMFMAWDDGINDRSLVAKDENNVCYLVFQGMNRHVIWDYVQTLSPLTQRNVFGTDCHVRRSFYRAYETPFADEMRAYLDQCVHSCELELEGAGPCPVVIAGHSTGAATATIASLDPRLRQYNPVTYALSPMRAILNECHDDVDSDNLFRIIAANAGYYDAASDGSPKMGRHYGQLFIMDELDEFYYIGADDNELRKPDDYNIHIIEVYLNRMNALLANRQNDDVNNYPMTLSQFPVGHWCNYDDECHPGNCANGVCQPTTAAAAGREVLSMAGAPCTTGLECASNNCLLGKCTMINGKAGTGAPCEDHSQCDSDKCFEGYCQDKLYNGSWCEEDYECLSDSCSGPCSWIGMCKCADPPEASEP